MSEELHRAIAIITDVLFEKIKEAPHLDDDTIPEGEPAFSIKIGPTDVAVYWQNPDCEACGIWTIYKYRHIIIVSPDLLLHDKLQTLWHEINHAAAFIFKQGRRLDEEEWVDFCATIQAMVLRDNSDFRQWYFDSFKSGKLKFPHGEHETK